MNYVHLAEISWSFAAQLVTSAPNSGVLSGCCLFFARCGSDCGQIIACFVVPASLFCRDTASVLQPVVYGDGVHWLWPPVVRWRLVTPRVIGMKITVVGSIFVTNCKPHGMRRCPSWTWSRREWWSLTPLWFQMSWVWRRFRTMLNRSGCCPAGPRKLSESLFRMPERNPGVSTTFR